MEDKLLSQQKHQVLAVVAGYRHDRNVELPRNGKNARLTVFVVVHHQLIRFCVQLEIVGKLREHFMVLLETSMTFEYVFHYLKNIDVLLYVWIVQTLKFCCKRFFLYGTRHLKLYLFLLS